MENATSKGSTRSTPEMYRANFLVSFWADDCAVDVMPYNNQLAWIAGQGMKRDAHDQGQCLLKHRWFVDMILEHGFGMSLV
jgi:hypothetical protein